LLSNNNVETLSFLTTSVSMSTNVATKPPLPTSQLASNQNQRNSTKVKKVI
jgi:hypothetical protein